MLPTRSADSALVAPVPSQVVLQDRFWHNHYHLEPYYVSGRGYDQYRPAFELGWVAAEKYPGDFASVMPLLAGQWASHSGTSLLDWPQVAAAVQAAWERVRHAESAMGLPAPELLALVQGLQCLNLQTTHSLQIVIEQAPPGLMQQVLQRHLQDFEAAARALARVFALPPSPPAERTLAITLQRGWKTVRATLGSRSVHSLLDTSEQAEEVLLLGYGTALRQGLPEPARALLQRQAMGVQRGMEALRWLRTCSPD